MWALLGTVRTAFQFVFGEDLLRWALYLLIGGIVFLTLNGIGVTNALQTQPFGAYIFGAKTAPVPSDAGLNLSPQDQAVPGARAAEPTLVPLPMTDIVASRVAIVIGAAMQYMGTPYVWGGCSHRGIDCSCFVLNALAAVGIHAPRVTTQQILWTTPVSAANARVGDLVYFDNTCTDCGANPTHVGLYLGEGRMADCGDPCKVEPVYGGHNARYGRVPGL